MCTILVEMLYNAYSFRTKYFADQQFQYTSRHFSLIFRKNVPFFEQPECVPFHLTAMFRISLLGPFLKQSARSPIRVPFLVQPTRPPFQLAFRSSSSRLALRSTFRSAFRSACSELVLAGRPVIRTGPPGMH